ncbi:19448_t:CDS:2, partial [Gigaspora margarita]
PFDSEDAPKLPAYQTSEGPFYENGEDIRYGYSKLSPDELEIAPRVFVTFKNNSCEKYPTIKTIFVMLKTDIYSHIVTTFGEVRQYPVPEIVSFSQILQGNFAIFLSYNFQCNKHSMSRQQLFPQIEPSLLIYGQIIEKGIKHEGVFGKDSNLAMSSYQIPEGCQILDPTLQNSEKTIRDLAQCILRDKLSIKNIKVKARALANSAPNANTELKNLGASFQIIEATKFPDITEEANKIQRDNRKKAEANRIDYPDHFTLESVRERLDGYDVSTSPNLQALADVMIMLCIRPAELITLRIINAGVTGKPGVKWFNRFLKDYGLIPKYLRKLGA